MSVIDRVESAKHIIQGSPIGRAVAKATSREIIGPKRKHVEYLTQVINFANVNVPYLVDLLFERTQNSSWIVTFKGLIVFHHLMSNGNERFIQCMASRSSTWMLQNFLDKSGVQGYDMSHAIRRYSHYLSEKAAIYRTMGYDICRAPRGKENGVVRNMDTTKLLKALPELQRHLDALLSTDISSNDLTNGVITAAFMLLFKDLIRLFAGYNDGIINLLEQYFDMKKQECKAALDIYKKFVNRMERVSSFLSVAEDVGIDKGDIPDLTQAPGSLLTALENHLQSLEKGKAFKPPPSNTITLPVFTVSDKTEKNFNPFEQDKFTAADEDVLEQERKALEEFEKKKKGASSPPSANQPPTPALNPPSYQQRGTSRSVQQPQKELLVTQAAQAPSAQPAASQDLLQLGGNLFGDSFQTNMTRSSSFPLRDQKQDVWGQQPTTATPMLPAAAAPASNPFHPVNDNASFSPVFQNSDAQNGSAFLGDLLTPEPANGSSQEVNQQDLFETNDTKDLSSSLARAAKSLDDLSINPNMQRVQTQKGKHQWKPQQPSVKTGGANFSGLSVARNTMPASSTPAGWGGAANQPVTMGATFSGQPGLGMYQQYGAQPTMMQSGPGMMPMQGQVNRFNAPFANQDPFGPVPGSQVRF